MDGLFISYRREDSAPYAGRIYDALRNSFPDLRFFMDIDAIQLLALAANVVYILLCAGQMWMMFTDPTKRTFAKHQDRVNRR